MYLSSAPALLIITLSCVYALEQPDASDMGVFSSPELQKRSDAMRHIELLSRRSALDKNFMRFGRSDHTAVAATSSLPEEFERFAKGGNNNDANFMRFGKSNNNNNDANFMRFGKSNADNFMRFGKSNADKFMRFGKSNNKNDGNFMRFGKNNGENFMRFGKSNADNFMRFGKANDGNFMRFGRGEGDNFMRFGKSGDSSFMRFGRNKLDDNFMRFGRQSDTNSNFMRFGRNPGNFMRFGRPEMDAIMDEESQQGGEEVDAEDSPEAITATGEDSGRRKRSSSTPVQTTSTFHMTSQPHASLWHEPIIDARREQDYHD